MHLKNDLYMLVMLNPDHRWYWDRVLKNPNISIDMVDDIRRISDLSDDEVWQALSKNANITMDIVLANPDKPWDYSKMSENRNLTTAMVLSKPDAPWNWEHIYAHARISSLAQMQVFAQKNIFVYVLRNELNWWIDSFYDRPMTFNDIYLRMDTMRWWMRIVEDNLFYNPYGVVNKRVMCKFINKLKQRVSMRNAHKTRFAACLLELVHLPGIGSEYFRHENEAMSIIDAY